MSIHHLNFIVETGDFEGFQGSVTESQEDKEVEFHEDIWPFARNLLKDLGLHRSYGYNLGTRTWGKRRAKFPIRSKPSSFLAISASRKSAYWINKTDDLYILCGCDSYNMHGRFLSCLHVNNDVKRPNFKSEVEVVKT